MAAPDPYLGVLVTPSEPSVEDTAPAVAAYVMAAVANPQDYISRRNLADLLWRTGLSDRSKTGRSYLQAVDAFFEPLLEGARP